MVLWDITCFLKTEKEKILHAFSSQTCFTTRIASLLSRNFLILRISYLNLQSVKLLKECSEICRPSCTKASNIVGRLVFVSLKSVLWEAPFPIEVDIRVILLKLKNQAFSYYNLHRPQFCHRKVIKILYQLHKSCKFTGIYNESLDCHYIMTTYQLWYTSLYALFTGSIKNFIAVVLNHDFIPQETS